MYVPLMFFSANYCMPNFHDESLSQSLITTCQIIKICQCVNSICSVLLKKLIFKSSLCLTPSVQDNLYGDCILLFGHYCRHWPHLSFPPSLKCTKPGIFWEMPRELYITGYLSSLIFCKATWACKRESRLFKNIYISRFFLLRCCLTKVKLWCW